MSTTPARIAVVDDDTDLAQAVARALERAGLPATPFDHPREALATLGKDPFGCLVSDMQMGGFDGFALAAAVRDADPCTALVFMTAWPRTTHAVDAIRMFGGFDYLEKPINLDRLVAAVEQGLAWSMRRRRKVAILASLTRREREVFNLLVTGHSNKEMAEELGISARTVEDHRASVMAKSRVNGLSQLIALDRGDPTDRIS